MTTATAMSTLALDPGTWDLTVDAAGNIAVAAPSYSLAQDAASRCRTFSGEVWYDSTRGIPYFSQVLGQPPPLELLRARYTAEADAVPGVISAQVFFTKFENRALSGQVQITDASGQTTAIGF